MGMIAGVIGTQIVLSKLKSNSLTAVFCNVRLLLLFFNFFFNFFNHYAHFNIQRSADSV